MGQGLSGWVWPLGQDPNQWQSLLASLQGQQGTQAQAQQPQTQAQGIPSVTVPGNNVPGVPGMLQPQPIQPQPTQSIPSGLGIGRDIGLAKSFLGVGKGIGDLTGLTGQGNEAIGGLLGGTGNYLGAGAAVAGLGLSLAGLINSIVNGQGTEGQYAQSGMGALLSAPSLAESTLPLLLGTTAAELGISGLGGLGLAGLPMLWPAIEGLVNMFKDPNLPYNSGNMSQYKSRLAADKIPAQMNQFMLRQNDPRELLGMATGALPLSPNQEVMFKAGGNPWGSDPYNSLLQGVLSGDPQATQDFLRTAEVTKGETGGVHQVDPLATDTYRRQLAHALGLTPEQTIGMFQGAPGDPNAWDLNKRMSNTMATMRAGQFDQAQLQDLYNALPGYAAEGYSDFGKMSPYYQDPMAGRLSQGDVAAYQNAIQEYLTANQAPAGLTPEEYQRRLAEGSYNPNWDYATGAPKGEG